MRTTSRSFQALLRWVRIMSYPSRASIPFEFGLSTEQSVSIPFLGRLQRQLWRPYRVFSMRRLALSSSVVICFSRLSSRQVQPRTILMMQSLRSSAFHSATVVASLPQVQAQQFISWKWLPLARLGRPLDHCSGGAAQARQELLRVLQRARGLLFHCGLLSPGFRLCILKAPLRLKVSPPNPLEEGSFCPVAEVFSGRTSPTDHSCDERAYFCLFLFALVVI